MSSNRKSNALTTMPPNRTIYATQYTHVAQWLERQSLIYA